MPARVVRAVVLAAFEPDEPGVVPGELTLWLGREPLLGAVRVPVAGAYPAAWWCEGTGVLALAMGVGAARAAASVMALGLDGGWDLERAWWLVTGVAGVTPERASLGSVVVPDWVVDGDVTHEVDGREIPAEWVDGFVPLGKVTPYEQPRAARFNADDGLVHRLELAGWARGVAAGVELVDTPEMAARRGQFAGACAGLPPGVYGGAELASSTFFHGQLLGERAARWVAYQTDGAGEYTLTAMEDAGVLTALGALGRAGRVDGARVLVVRGASNYDRQREGVSAAESLGETRVASYSAYRPALENCWRVGSRVVEEWLGSWAEREGCR